ncbi:hypothetical protein R3W88_016133 [Solanum pinnatisectum]|uniref:Endonuclease/exonuclease/phosphatase domain-containing protein n=1 Tax=Solanum pinnatisectum TaxID=50273 RepID=A0AAV9KYX4_9SOLN|nr:hypothetical protein R3W88_016133 [Solanum pinnatisectum]
MAEIADFQQCIENSGIIEMSKTGSRYTWRVGHGEDRIIPKIDWVFINTDWINNMPNYKAQFLPKGISDHCPLKLCFSQVQRRSRPTFKYCNVWAYHPNFEYIVREGWNQPDKEEKFRQSSYVAEVYLQQRSKTTWIKVGDDKTRNFISMIKHKKLQQAIIQVIDNQMKLQVDPENITSVFVQFYQELLGTKEENIRGLV